jgi:inhibitor of cysteine peptidase
MRNEGYGFYKWWLLMQEIELTENDHGRSYEIGLGGFITIRIPEIPTTGYRWVVREFNDQVISFKDSNYSIDPGGQIGGGGISTFSFKAISPGQSNLVLVLEREWEKDKPIKRFEIAVNVK